MFKSGFAIIICIFNFFVLQGILEYLEKTGFSNNYPLIWLSLHSLFFLICYLAYKFSNDFELDFLEKQKNIRYNHNKKE